MFYEEQTESPKIERVEVDSYIRFKAKDGVFEVYDKATKAKKELKEISILPVNDSRFTIKPAQNDEGSFLFSGMYRSTKQHLTVLRHENGRTSIEAEGDWQTIKSNPNLKYTRVLYCVLRDGEESKRAEFTLQGIGLVQWGGIRSNENIVNILAVSADKSFKTPKGMFYEMTLKEKVKTTTKEEEKALALVDDIQRSFASHDANYSYRAKLRNQPEAPVSIETAAKIMNPEQKDVLNLDATGEDEVDITKVPF